MAGLELLYCGACHLFATWYRCLALRAVLVIVLLLWSLKLWSQLQVSAVDTVSVTCLLLVVRILHDA